MQVETFECTETASEPIEIAEEAIAMCEQMGLVGQLTLAKPRNDEERGERMPYREMEADEFFAYSVLCPQVYEPEKYDRSPMPLRILQVLAHAKQSEMFTKIVVWDRAESQIKDPILIGERKKPGSEWQTQRFILARWGEHLESFSTLLAQALKQRRESLIQRLKEIQSRVSIAIASAESASDQTIIRYGNSEPYFNSQL